MGGAVSALFLARYPHYVCKAVLSAPLIEPHVEGAPMPLARLAIQLGCCFYGKKANFKRIKTENNQGHGAHTMPNISRNRFLHNLEMRMQEPHYVSTSMTFGWLNQTLRLRHTLLSSRVTKRITTPILLLSAERDTVVNNELQHRFSEKCATCTLITLPDAGHGMLVDTPETIEKHITYVMDFYRS